MDVMRKKEDKQKREGETQVDIAKVEQEQGGKTGRKDTN